LKSDGQNLPVLAFEQGHDLLKVVADVSKRRVVLIFDAWEKAASIVNERDFLELYLKHREDWPTVHFIVAVREPDAAKAADDAALEAARHVKASNGTVGRLDLKAMDLASPDEKARLLAYVRICLPKASAVTDEQILGILEAYPATLERWAENPELSTPAELKAAADDARYFLYDELHQSLPALTKGERTLAMRLCLLPRMAPAPWALLRGLVEEGLEKDGWLDCCESGLFMNEPYPTFGHDTRHQAVAVWFKTAKNGAYFQSLRAEANRLVFRMSQVLDLSRPHTVTVLQALRIVAGTMGIENLDAYPRLIAKMTAALWREDVGAALLEAEPWPDTQESRKRISSLLARALYNSVLDAALAAKDPELSKSLLGVLRRLHQDFPGDRTIVQCFGMVTVDVAQICRNSGKDEDAKALLAELRGLAELTPSEPGLWHEYGTALYNKILILLRKGSLADALPVLDELRALPPQPPDVAAQRLLGDTLRMSITVAAPIPAAAETVDAWLNELEKHAAVYWQDGYHLKNLAVSLRAIGVAAYERQDPTRVGRSLDRLNQLAGEKPPEVVAEELVNLEVYVLRTKLPENVLGQFRTVMEQIQKLARAFPANPRLTYQVATVQELMRRRIEAPSFVALDRGTALADLASLAP
jgi:tetratricopeptide (TPR) repeat protein